MLDLSLSVCNWRTAILGLFTTKLLPKKKSKKRHRLLRSFFIRPLSASGLNSPSPHFSIMLRGPVPASTFPALDHFPREAGSSGHVYPFPARSASPIMPQSATQDMRSGFPAGMASSTFWRSPYSETFRHVRSSSSTRSRGGTDSGGGGGGGGGGAGAGADAGQSRAVSPGQRVGSAPRSPLCERNDGGQEKIVQDSKVCASSSASPSLSPSAAGTLERRKTGGILKGGGGDEGSGGGGGGVGEEGGGGGGGVSSESQGAGMDTGSDTSSENVRQIRGILCKSSLSSSSRQSGSKIQKRVKFDDCVDNKEEENGRSCRSPHSPPNTFSNGVGGAHLRHDQHEHPQPHHHNPNHQRSMSASAVPCNGGGRNSTLLRMPSLRIDGDRLQSVDKSCLTHSQQPGSANNPHQAPINPHHHPYIPRPGSGPLIRTSSVPDLTMNLPRPTSRGSGSQSAAVQSVPHTPHAAAAAAFHLLQGPTTASPSPYPHHHQHHHHHHHHNSNSCAPSSVGSSRVTSAMSALSSNQHNYNQQHLHHHPALEFRIIRQQNSSCGSPRVSDTGLPQSVRCSSPPASGSNNPQGRTPRFFAASRSHSTGPREGGGGPLVRLSRSLTSPSITFQRPVKRSTMSSSSSSRAREAESLPMVNSATGQPRGLVSSSTNHELSSHHHHHHHHRHHATISSRGGGDGVVHSRVLDGRGSHGAGLEVEGVCVGEEGVNLGKEEEEQEVRESFLDDDKTVQILNWLQEVDHKQAREGRCPVFVNHNIHRES